MTEGWYEGSELAIFANNKEGCMSSNSHLNNITNYYTNLLVCIAALSELVHKQHQYIRSLHVPIGRNYLTGSKRPRSVENTAPPLNHDMVILILHCMCLYLDNQESSEQDAQDFQPFHLTKMGHTHLVFGEGINICSSTNILDLGGGRYSKKRQILHCICGPNVV